MYYDTSSDNLYLPVQVGEVEHDGGAGGLQLAVPGHAAHVRTRAPRHALEHAAPQLVLLLQPTVTSVITITILPGTRSTAGSGAGCRGLDSGPAS